jgi:competence protein ComEA
LRKGVVVLRELRDWAEELACRAGLDGLPSGSRLVAVVVAAVAVCAAAWMWWNPGATGASTGPTLPAGGASATTTAPVSSRAATPAIAATITVHVVGEVRRPGVYRLAGGSRATDAVAAAGGLLGDADQAAVNLARVVADGEQIAVPREGQAVHGAGGTGGGAGAVSGVAGGKVDLNTASVEQLDTLPGVGPSTAQKIVADRTANGPFRTVDDLLRVPGIGPAKLEALKDLVTAG